MDTATTPRLIDAPVLHERLESGWTPRLLDVRTPEEFDDAVIPDAYNVPLDTLEDHRAEFAGQLTDEFVVVCRSGRRAVPAAQFLRDLGVTEVLILDGGMIAWQDCGFEVRHGTPPADTPLS